jgi:tetratricopeptide (TPR) repeat protein
LYLLRSQFPEAEQQYRRAVELAPELATAHMNLGLALEQQGRFAEAEKSLMSALRLRRSSLLLMNIGALYYAQERYADALRYFEASLSAGAPAADYYRNLGDARRHLGNKREVNAAYRQAKALAEEDVARNPRDGGARITLALVSAFLGDARRARLESAQALGLEPENAWVVRDAAITYEALGDRDRSLALLENAPAFLLRELSRQPDVKPLAADPRFQLLLQNSVARK